MSSQQQICGFEGCEVLTLERWYFWAFLEYLAKHLCHERQLWKKMELQKATECDISIPPFLNSASDLLSKSIHLWWIPQRNQNKPRKAPLAENLAAAAAAAAPSTLQFTAADTSNTSKFTTFSAHKGQSLDTISTYRCVYHSRNVEYMLE